MKYVLFLFIILLIQAIVCLLDVNSLINTNIAEIISFTCVGAIWSSIITYNYLGVKK